MKKRAITIHELLLYLTKKSISNGAAIWKICQFYKELFHKALLIILTFLRMNFSSFKRAQTVVFPNRFLIQYQNLIRFSQAMPLRVRKDTSAPVFTFIISLFWVVYLFGD